MEERNRGGYKLNTDVKCPTPALLKAAAIGITVYDTPEKQALPNRDAILVTCFGSTYPEAREQALLPIANAIAKQHPDVPVLLSFSSQIVCRTLRDRDGLDVLTPVEALHQLAAAGYTRIAVAPLEVVPGVEYYKTKELCAAYSYLFKRLSFGTSLLYWMGQEEQPDDVAEFVDTLATQLPKPAADEAVLVLVHGTRHPANAYYSVLQSRLDTGLDGHYFVYCLEGKPVLADILPKLQAHGVRKVYLFPLLIAAGKHALQDMVGERPDTHEHQLQAAGFAVQPILRGLGEYAPMQQLFARKADDAWVQLHTEPPKPPVSTCMRH